MKVYKCSIYLLTHLHNVTLFVTHRAPVGRRLSGRGRGGSALLTVRRQGVGDAYRMCMRRASRV